MFSMSPPYALNVTRFPAAANCGAALSRNGRHRRFGNPYRTRVLHRCGIKLSAGPKVRNASAVWSLRTSSTALDVAFECLSPKNAFGGATVSSAPESTTASTKRDPALGVALTTAQHRFRLHLPHQVLDSRHAGVPTPFWSIAPTYFLPASQGWQDLTVVFFWIPARVRGSVCGTTIVGLCQNFKPVCHTLF